LANDKTATKKTAKKRKHNTRIGAINKSMQVQRTKEDARLCSPNPTLVGSRTAPKPAAAADPFRAATPPPPLLLLQVSRATGRLVGRSFEKELGSRKPWSVGLGVEHCDSPPVSDGGEGESPGPRPAPTP
jgi:hypothetical protein